MASSSSFRLFACAIIVWFEHCLPSEIGSRFLHDGHTVYCWKLQRDQYGINAIQPYSYCDVGLKMEAKKTQVLTNERIPITWTATNLQRKNFPKSELLEGVNKISDKNFSIHHSAIYACEYGKNCSALGGKTLSLSTNQVGNFNSKGEITFRTDEVSFNHPGVYSVYAHIQVPSSKISTFDYVAFLKIAVSSPKRKDISAKNNVIENQADENQIPSSTVILIASIIAGAVLCIALILCAMYLRRLKHRSNQLNQNAVSTAGYFSHHEASSF